MRGAIPPLPHTSSWRVPVVLSLAVKWPDREADYSPPPTANVINAWSYTSTPPYAFMEWCLIKQAMSSWLGAQLNTVALPLPH